MKKNRIKSVLTGLLLTGVTLGYSPDGGLRVTTAGVQAKHENESWKEDETSEDWKALGITNSQMPTDGDYSCWNWEDQSQANWRKQTSTGWVDIISPPFSPSADNVNLMLDIDRKGDYTSALGWELVWANFQTEHPYFILYNRHRSIVRLFFYLDGTESYSHIMATLSFVADTENPAVLSSGKGLPTAAYTGSDSSTGKDDMISVVIPLARKHWGAAEFPVLYDNNIQNYQNKLWIFTVYGVNESQINLTGVAGSNSAILNLKTEQYTMISPKNAVSGSTFSADYAKFHKQIKDIDDLLQVWKKSTDGIKTTSPQFLQDYKAAVTGINSFASVVTGTSAGFSAVLGFFNLISGIFGKSAPPTATIQYINLSGTITNIVPLFPRALTVPGTSGSYYPPDVTWNPFNCPMGLINLKDSVTIKRTTAYRRYGNNDKNVIVEKDHNTFGRLILTPDMYLHFHKLPTSGSTWTVSDDKEWRVGRVHSGGFGTSSSSGYRGGFVQYKFDDDITLVTQTIEGLTLQDIQVAIVCKPNGTGVYKYNIYDKYLIYHEFYYDVYEHYSLPSNKTRIPLDNPVYKALTDGRLVVHKFDEGDKDNDGDDEVYFGTPFMERSQLKGTVLEVPAETEVKLAVYARFSSDKYPDEPVIFKAMYDFNPITEQAKLAGCTKTAPAWACDVTTVYFTQEIGNFGFSDYCKNYVAPVPPAVRNLETENIDFGCNVEKNCN